MPAGRRPPRSWPPGRAPSSGISGNGWNTMPLAGCWRWMIRGVGRWLAGTPCCPGTSLFSPTPAISATRRSTVSR